MRRTVLLVMSLLLVVTATPAGAAVTEVDRALVVREFLEDGTAAPAPLEQVGSSRLVRKPDSLRADVRVRGLIPGGVYTFWWIVLQEDGAFPDDIFVANGAGVVVGEDGTAKVRMRAELGQESITGFEPAPGVELTFADLVDPLGSLVRVEIAYHGRAEDAGDELPVWLYDFWTGDACPPETPNPNPAQPHCPVWYAATHD